MSNLPLESDGSVLVVDDEAGIREALAELVEMEGCTAIVASNGAEALKVLALPRPCLIILDRMMPVMTGQELLDQMRGISGWSSIPIVISTSSPARAPTGFPVVAKPIDVEVIWTWIRRSCHCSLAQIG